MVGIDTGTSKDPNASVSASETIKKLGTKKIELESDILLEKSRPIGEVKKRDVLKKNLDEIEAGMQSWETLTNTISPSDTVGVYASATDEIKRLVDERDALQQKIITLLTGVSSELDTGPFTSETNFQDVQKAYPALQKIAQNKLQSYDDTIKKVEKTREDFLLLKKQELDQVNLDIERAKLVKKSQISGVAKNILLYLSIFLGLLIIRYLSGRVIARFQEDFSRPHREAMWFVHRWSFRAIFLIAFLVLFSSEFAAFLPFIAIMATAIGFALRDVVYSFIGWFMIGASDGYQDGDIIEFDALRGKVFRITPLITTLEEYGSQGVTGKMVSFPNKIIFDKTITNLSRAHGFTLISLDFLLTHTSDIERAREVLMDVIGQDDLTLYYNSRGVVNKLRYVYGYEDADLHPRIDVIVEPKGIILRAKVFTHVENILDIQTKISEDFCKKVQTEKKVDLQKG